MIGWPKTRGQRCWVHKTSNVRNKLPKSQQPKAKRALQEIWMAETKKDALAAFEAFVETWGVKYEKAVECLTKNREALLAFYDFPAEHWKHLRTTNVIESAFATVRHRTVRAKGCLSNKTALAMIFKLAEGKVGKLTDDDLSVINGNRGQLEGRIQQRYGYAKDQVKRDVDEWCNSQRF
jgi:putative transposase